MKTNIVSTRLTPLSIVRIKQYFNYCTTRELIEAILRLSSCDNKLRQKITLDIRLNKKQTKLIQPLAAISEKI